MMLETKLDTNGMRLDAVVERRIRHHLEALGRRLAKRAAPVAVLVLRERMGARAVEAHLRLQLEPLGVHLVAHQAAETPDRAVRLAVEDVQRQLERHTSGQRAEHTFGVPSRRLPAQLRPHPPGAEEGGDEEHRELE